LTTVTSTLTSAVGGTVTATSTVTVTSVSTQTTQILGNIWGVSLAVVLFAGATASYLIPKAGSKRPKGIVCRSCDTLNPPFARAWCVKCGASLKGAS
jgi:ribosomal protein L40E